MGSSGSKKKEIKVKEIGIDEFYERVLRNTQPVPVEFFKEEGGSGEGRIQEDQDGYGEFREGILVDQSCGQPVLADLKKFSKANLCFPVNNSARIAMVSSECLLVVSSRNVVQVSFPSLKQVKMMPMIMQRDNFSITTCGGKIVRSGKLMAC